MPTAAQLRIVIEAVDKASGALGKTQEAVQRANEASLRGIRNIGLALTGLGVGALAASAKTTQAFREVEEAWASVATLVEGGVQDVMATFGDEIARITRELPVQGGEVGALEGLYRVLSAGITDAADATAVLETSLKLAAAGQTTAESATRALTAALNAYGLAGSEAGRVSDVLFTLVQRGVPTFEEWSSQIGRVVAIAPTLGVSLEEAAAALASLTKAGQSAEQATTGLRATMNALLAPTPQLQEALEALGFATGQEAIQALGLQGTLQALKEQVGDNETAFANLFGALEAKAAVLPLAGTQAQSFREDLEAMRNATGAMEGAFEDMAGTVEARMKRLDNRIAAAMASIGSNTSPTMLGLKEAAAAALEGVAALDAQMGGIIGTAVSLTGVIGSTVGPIIAATAQLALMSTAMDLATLKAHLLKIAMIGIPIFAVIAAIALLITHWDQVSAAMGQVWAFLQEKLSPAFQFLRLWLDANLQVLRILADVVGGPVLQALEVVGAFLHDVLLRALEAVSGGVDGMKQAFADFAVWLATLWVEQLRQALNLADFLFDIGTQFVGWVADGIRSTFGDIFALGREFLVSLINGILSHLGPLEGAARAALEAVLGPLTSSPQLDPAIARRFERVGTEMSGALAQGLAAGSSEAEAAMGRTLGRLEGARGRVGGGSSIGSQVNFAPGSIVVHASGREEGRNAARAFMAELRRQGVTVRLGA